MESLGEFCFKTRQLFMMLVLQLNLQGAAINVRQQEVGEEGLRMSSNLRTIVLERYLFIVIVYYPFVNKLRNTLQNIYYIIYLRQKANIY